MERDTGRSKGFGFVEMSSPAEAQAAIDGMNGQQHGGRGLVVNEARPDGAAHRQRPAAPAVLSSHCAPSARPARAPERTTWPRKN